MSTVRAFTLLGVLGVAAAAGCFTGSPAPQADDLVTTPGEKPAAPGTLPLSRLTRAQYASTIRVLFGAAADDVTLPPADATVDGYDDNVVAQSPSAALVEAYQTAASTLATAALSRPAEFLHCTPTSRPDEDACASAFFGSFGARVYRRPLRPADETALRSFYETLRSTGTDFVSTMRLVLQGMLQGPDFLYRVEAGTPSAPGAVRLGGYELASRLSYLIWNTMPDEALFAAASAGQLDSDAGLETETRRLLADPRAQDGMRAFYSQWLQLSKMDQLSKDPTLFPEFDVDVATSMRAATDLLAASAFTGQGTLTKLLTDPHAFVNDTLAPLYGIPAPGSATPVLTAVDPAQRAGILTDVGMLAALAHDTEPAPVLRGVFVLDRLLCSPPPPPPPDVASAPPADQNQPTTQRQRFQQQHEQGACKGCHAAIDGIGFGFDHYDAIGRWRTEDSKLPVDATGEFASIGDLDSTFDGAVQMGQQLAASHTVHSCVAAQWTRYALGIDAASVDADALAPVVTAFEASGLQLGELVVAFVKSNAFRTRTVQP